MNRYERLRDGLALLIVIALTTGCMGVVKNRSPKIPRRERNVQVGTVPVIDLMFVCTAPNVNDWEPYEACEKQIKAFKKVVKEFDFLSDASERAEAYDYRLVVRTDWHQDQTEDSWTTPVSTEPCFYVMMLMLPCITKERLETSAELITPDGNIVGRAESSADRTFVSHFVGIWLFPLGLPSLPTYLRFSTNTYRNLLPQIGRRLTEDLANRDPRKGAAPAEPAAN